jgi:hypothetical protein
VPFSATSGAVRVPLKLPPSQYLTYATAKSANAVREALPESMPLPPSTPTATGGYVAEDPPVPLARMWQFAPQWLELGSQGCWMSEG